MKEQDKDNQGISRRDFVKCSAVLGGALLSSQFEWAADLMKRAEAGTLAPEEEYELIRAENTLYTVCLQCNTGCGIKVKLFRKNGSAVALKIDGNPYDPFVSVPHIPHQSSPSGGEHRRHGDLPERAGRPADRLRSLPDHQSPQAGREARAREDGRPFPSNRRSRRSSTAGVLFKDVSGEENRKVEGLTNIALLRDPKIFKELADGLAPIRRAKTPEEKKAAVEEYKKKYAAYLHYLIDPDHPDLGPKNNQIVFGWGRMKGGRSDFSAGRFFGDALGTVNRHGHTTVCQGSLYFSGKAMSEQYDEGSWRGGAKFYWQTELEGAEFVLFVGANLLDANYGPPNRAARLIPNITSGKTKIAVADPRFSKLASKAWKYLPDQPRRGRSSGPGDDAVDS